MARTPIARDINASPYTLGATRYAVLHLINGTGDSVSVTVNGVSFTLSSASGGRSQVGPVVVPNGATITATGRVFATGYEYDL